MEEERTTGSNTIGRRCRSGGRKSRLVVISVALLLILYFFWTPKVYASRSIDLSLDPTFGYTTIGPTVTNSIVNAIRGSVFTISEAGRADSITVALSGGGSTWTGNVKCAIYRRSDLILVGSTEERTSLSVGSSAGWYTFNFQAKPSLTAGTEYILVAWSNAGSGPLYLAQAAEPEPNKSTGQFLAYGSWPDPAGFTGYLNNKYSIYCSYTLLPSVDTYTDNTYSTHKGTYSIGETVYAKGINLNTGSLYDFKYFKTGEGSARWTEASVGENPNPPNEWRSGTCLLESGWPTGDWEGRVYDAGTSTLRCSCGFTVVAVPEFPYGAMVALIAGFAIFLVERKTLRRRREDS